MAKLWDNIKHLVKGELTEEQITQLEDASKEELDEMTDEGHKTHQQEVLSFITKANKMSSQPFSREEKRELLSDYVNELSEGAFFSYFPQICDIVQESKDNCKPFKNTEEQVKNIISWLPRMKEYEDVLTLIIQKRRKKYKLEV
jgi:hypothetical protein